MATRIDHYLTPEMQASQKEKTSESAGIIMLADAEYVVVGDTSQIAVDSAGTVHSGYVSKSMNWISKDSGTFPALPKASGHKTILKVSQTVTSHSSSTATGDKTADGYELYIDDGSVALTSVKEGAYYPSNGYWRYSNGNQVVKTLELYSFAEETSYFTSLTSSERSSAGVSGTYYWLSNASFTPGKKGDTYPVKTSSGTVKKAKWTGSNFKDTSTGSVISGVTHFAISGSFVSSVSYLEKSNVL